MIELRVDGMTCGHCVRAVTSAVESIDPEANVEIYLEDGRLRAETRKSMADVIEAIQGAGYSAAPMSAAAPKVAPAKGCSCQGGKCGSRSTS